MNKFTAGLLVVAMAVSGCATTTVPTKTHAEHEQEVIAINALRADCGKKDNREEMIDRCVRVAQGFSAQEPHRQPDSPPILVELINGMVRQAAQTQWHSYTGPNGNTIRCSTYGVGTSATRTVCR